MPALRQELPERRGRVPRRQLRGQEGRRRRRSGHGRRRRRQSEERRHRWAGDTRGQPPAGEAVKGNRFRRQERPRVFDGRQDEAEQFGAGGEEGGAAVVLCAENAVVVVLRSSGVSDLQRAVRQERHRRTRGQLRRGGLRVTQGLRSARQRQA